MSELVRCPACGRFAAGQSDWTTDQPVRCPHCLAEFVLGGAVTQPLPRLIPVAHADEPTSDASDEAATEAVAPPSIGEPSTVPSDPPRPEIVVQTGPHDTGDSLKGLPSVYAGAEDFLTDEQRRQIDSAAAVAARVRGRGPKKRNALAELFKIVLGGIIGLAIGYWVLNYVKGESCDWLKVYLPGCPHTYEHWPVEHFRPPAGPQEPADPAEPVESAEPVEPDASADPPRPDGIPQLPGLNKPQTSPPPDGTQPPEASQDAPPPSEVGTAASTAKAETGDKEPTNE